MKKIYLFLFAYGIFNVFSQTQITLTFIGKDSLTQNLISLESVYVKNLTEDCDTTVFGTPPELTLMANWPVGIGENSANFSGSFDLKQNYPNPFQGSTVVNIYREYGGLLNMVLIDGLGKKVVDYHNELEKGLNTFLISSSGKKVLLLLVFDDLNNQSIKIISSGHGRNTNTIQFLGHVPNVEKNNLKNSENSGFIFYLGNQLMYSAYANGYNSKTIMDSPYASNTYTFLMAPEGVVPTVTTTAVTNITLTTATSGGNVTSDGGAIVTMRGVCWSTSANPTISESHTTDGSGLGEFVSNVTGLTGGTLYYVRAYATNGVGTSYGNELTLTTLTYQPCPSIPSLIYEGQIYNTVQIGTQCWFKENLNVGTRINGNQNQTNNGIFEKYCNDDNEANCNTYGGLYQWDELMQYVTTIGAKGLCPDGWHIPTDAEWTTLTTYLGGESVAGGKMKETGTAHWLFPNTGATNESGFTALPGGYRNMSGGFGPLGNYASFYSSTENSSALTWFRSLNGYSDSVGRECGLKPQGSSARCVRD